MSDNNYPVIMIYGSDGVVLGVARSLGVKNIPVKLINWYKYTPANYSKFVEPIIFPDPIENEKEFIQLLISYGKSMCNEYNRRLLLLPSADNALLIISNYYEELIKYFIILGDSTEKKGIEQFIRKDYFFEMVKKVDLPTPLTIPCINDSDIDYAVKNIPYPCVVKPIIKDINFSFFDRYNAKAIEFDSPEPLYSTLSELLKGGYEVLVQEKIPGNYGVNTLDFFSNREGDIIAAFASFQARQDRPQYGTCTIMESKWIPELFEYGKKIIKSLKYWGMGTLEYKKDPRDGKFKFIELNVRPVLSIYKVTGGGVNIPFIGYQDIYEKVNQKNVITPSYETNGLRWISLLEDFLVVMRSNYGLVTRIKMFMSSLHGKRVYNIFSLNDPLPAVIHLLLLFKNLFK
jgi:predicted ATP-grasp superfamily ATP-dependent carboligase